MTMIDRIRQLAALGFVVAVGVCLHAGLGVQLAVAQTKAPGGYTQFGPNHESEAPGFGIQTLPVVPNFGVDPVLPGRALPHSRTPTAFFPMVKDSRLTFDAALAADGVPIGGFGGFGLGGFGYGGYGYPFPNSTFGMGMGGGFPAAGNAGPIPLGVAPEDVFADAANGRPSARRSVRSNRATSARRPTVRKPTPQPSREVEARVADAAPSQLGTASARPEQANKAVERTSAVKSEETRSPPRRSMLGPPR